MNEMSKNCKLQQYQLRQYMNESSYVISCKIPSFNIAYSGSNLKINPSNHIWSFLDQGYSAGT